MISQAYNWQRKLLNDGAGHTPAYPPAKMWEKPHKNLRQHTYALALVMSKWDALLTRTSAVFRSLHM